MSKKILVLDANETAFFEEQTKYIQKKVYEVKHRQYRALEILSVDDSAPSGTLTIEVRYFDAVGVAAIISDYGKGSIPRVDVFGYTKTLKVKPIASSYGYTVPEIKRASSSGSTLPADKGIMGRKSVDIKHDQIAWSGDADHGLYGLLNYPGLLEFTVPGIGAGGLKTFASMTPAQIVSVVRDHLSAVRQATNGVEQANTYLLPIAQFDYIKGTPFGPEGTKTILTFLKETFTEITLWDSVIDLKGAGAGGTDRAMAFNRDSTHVQYLMPTMPEQQEPEKDGLEYVTVIYSESAGVFVKYPLSACFADGV